MGVGLGQQPLLDPAPQHEEQVVDLRRGGLPDGVALQGVEERRRTRGVPDPFPGFGTVKVVASSSTVVLVPSAAVVVVFLWLVFGSAAPAMSEPRNFAPSAVVSSDWSARLPTESTSLSPSDMLRKMSVLPSTSSRPCMP